MRLSLVVLALSIPVAAAACASQPKSQVGVAHVTYAPAPVTHGNIESYPHTWYQDHPVYLISGRWWYRDNGRWAYYSPEPDHLAATRKSIEDMPSGDDEQAIRRIDAPLR